MFCIFLNCLSDISRKSVALSDIYVFIQVEDPLLEATKYLKLLQKNSPDSLETHLLSFEVNVRKQKVLLAFQVSFCLSVWLRSFYFDPLFVLSCIRPTDD